MNRFVRIILASLGLCSGCSKSPVLTPSQFTREFAEAICRSLAGLRVEVVRDLELKVTTSEGEERVCSLDNPYAAYRQDRTRLAELQRSFITALETIMAPRQAVDSTRIVPVIKDRLWLEGGRTMLPESDAEKIREVLRDDFTTDLIILYAEEVQEAMRFLSHEDLEAAKIERKELRTLACENLKRLLPKMECHGSDGLYMITAGGVYESSLLLLDSFWRSGQLAVRGDIVVGIPARGLLLVTGSEYPEGIDKVREDVRGAYAQGPYKVTPKLVIYRDGRWAEFVDSVEPDDSPKGNVAGRPSK